MSIARDIVFALRQFRRHPWLPIAIVISLGAAMGVSTSMFSLVNAFWFAPWRVPDASTVRIVHPEISVDEWRALSGSTRTLSGLVAHRLNAVRIDTGVLYVEGTSANYFEVLRVPMAAGRPFTTAESDARVAVLSYAYWSSAFGRDPAIVGKTIVLDPNTGLASSGAAVSLTVVGVADESFGGTDVFRPDLWRPLDAPSRTPISVFGRLAPRISESPAQSELNELSRRYAEEHQLHPVTLQLTTTDRYSQSPGSSLADRLSGLWNSTFAGVFFITLVACANVMNLLLALGQSRRGEIALRLALGASRARVIRQILTETMVLSLLAAGVGLAIGAWLPGALIGRVARLAPRFVDLVRPTIDFRVFAWCLFVSIVACFGFGLIPALRATEGGLNDAMKKSAPNARKALMPVLLSVQTIVSAMALAIAGFMLRSESVRQARLLDASPAAIAAIVVAGFGAVAVLLGAIGYFSMLEYLVGQRTREIGIRRALGAQNANIIRAVTVGAAVPIARGFLIGGVGAGIVGIVLRRANTPAGVHPFDALTYAAVAVVLLATTTGAAFWPTRRALRIEPQEALRSE